MPLRPCGKWSCRSISSFVNRTHCSSFFTLSYSGKTAAARLLSQCLTPLQLCIVYAKGGMTMHVLSALLFAVSANIDCLAIGLSYGIQSVKNRCSKQFDHCSDIHCGYPDLHACRKTAGSTLLSGYCQPNRSCPADADRLLDSVSKSQDTAEKSEGI